MLSFIRGTVADLTENSAIIESNCIGFEINMTGNALAQLHIGQEVKLHTYFQVREDAMVLYGFFSKDDLQVFKLLLGVNGVGPKAALGVLAGITADELRFAVRWKILRHGSCSRTLLPGSLQDMSRFLQAVCGRMHPRNLRSFQVRRRSVRQRGGFPRIRQSQRKISS